jgi:hypothetical protein
VFARKAIAILLVGLPALTVCTDTATNTAEPSTSSEHTVSISPSPTKLPKLPLDEARLQGKYNVKLFVRRSNFGSRPSKQQVFSFQPLCQQGSCDVNMRARIAFDPTPGGEQRQQAGANPKFTVKLRQLGKSYAGFTNGFFATCIVNGNAAAEKDRWSFNLRVATAKYIGDRWTVTRWEGTWTRSASFAGTACAPGHLAAVIRGSRT